MKEYPVPETQESTASAVHEARAYQVRPERPFIYVSRIISPDYVDIRLLNGNPKQRTVVIRDLIAIINNIMDSTGTDFFAICGYVTADLTFGGIVADKMGLPYFYVRDADKAHGKGKRIEGVAEEDLAGKEVLHLGDLLTKGTTSKQLAEAVRSVGGIVRYHVPIFDRLQGGREELSSIGIEVVPACIMDSSFYRIGAEQGLISEHAMYEIARYRANGIEWARDYLRKHPEFFKAVFQKPDAIVNGMLKSKVQEVLEVLTMGYPELVAEFSPQIKKLLEEFNVTQDVPVFGFIP
jgi:orotate phosphoribosyltransferase